MILETQTYEQGLQRAYDICKDWLNKQTTNITPGQAFGVQAVAEQIAEEIGMVQGLDDNLLTSP